VPPGWPTPTDKWIRDNAFWQPPTGWTPIEKVRAAPEGWQFWTTNKLWQRSIGDRLRSVVILRRIANWLALIWLATLVAAFLLDYPPLLRLVGFAAALSAFGLVVVSEVLRARKSKRLIAEFAVVAERGRRDRLTREYQRYLTAMA
jgi:hypothetical protein